LIWVSNLSFPDPSLEAKTVLPCPTPVFCFRVDKGPGFPLFTKAAGTQRHCRGELLKCPPPPFQPFRQRLVNLVFPRTPSTLFWSRVFVWFRFFLKEGHQCHISPPSPLSTFVSGKKHFCILNRKQRQRPVCNPIPKPPLSLPSPAFSPFDAPSSWPLHFPFPGVSPES